MKHEFEKFDLTLYTYKLENGLNIYVVPDSRVNNIYATFSTKYGSKHSSFVPNGSKKMVTVPDGIAHFLEHKLFEQPDGTEPFAYFGERGADANANTTQFKTTYLFSGTDHLDENLNYLLDYVQTPYFTDENVEKEKGIIEQEIKMYYDEPSWRILEDAIFNTFEEDPVRISIAGTVKSIKTITKEDLYLCYNTFYHPANMFVVVTGNVNPEEIYNIVKENQSKKEFVKEFNLKLKDYKETNEVSKNHQTIKMNVTIPKTAVTFKLNIGQIKGFSKKDIISYLTIFFDAKFGQTSSLVQRLKDEKIISDTIDTYFIDSGDYFVYYVEGDSKLPEELIENIKKEVTNFEISEAEFERKKKVYLSSFITVSDNIFAMNSLVMNNVVKYGEVLTDIYYKIKNYNYEDLQAIINKINFSHTSEVIILPKKEDK